MPYQSLAQEHWAHTPEGQKALGGPAKVKEWDQATKGRHLPAKVQHFADGGPVMANKGYVSRSEDYAKGGGSLPRSEQWSKEDINNQRQADDKPTYGNFLDGVDRFTSANMADQGSPANMQRIKPDEDWGKNHVKNKAVRQGDTKSEKPVKPRK